MVLLPVNLKQQKSLTTLALTYSNTTSLWFVLLDVGKNLTVV